jgi:RNA polymerase primary sigma factor
MDRFPSLHENRALGTYLREISRIPLVTPEEEKELARAIRGGNETALNRLAEANLRFVVFTAKQYRNRGLSFLDLINEGNIGLLRACKSFDPERGVRFVSYAVWWIRQAILAALLDKANLVRVPQSRVKKFRKASKRLRFLEARKGSPLSDAEALSETSFSRESLDDLKRFTQGYLSLDTTRVGASEKPLLEMIKSVDGIEAIEKSLMEHSLSKKLQGAIQTLPPRDGQVLTWRYGLDGRPSRTLDEIGRALKLSKERVRQIEERAVRRLREKKGFDVFRDYVV